MPDKDIALPNSIWRNLFIILATISMPPEEALAENNSQAVKDVLAQAGDIADIVKGYKEELEAALTEIRKNAEEKQSLEEMLCSVQKALETLKLADLEFGNEVAELLVLANIPNAKKEELYSRHRAAVDAIETAEKTEVVTNDGIEA